MGLLGILDLFNLILTGDEVHSDKPNPEIYLKTAKKLNLNPEECVVVEDSPPGILAAKNANMKVIALQTPFFDKKDLSNADIIITNLSEIKTIILS